MKASAIHGRADHWGVEGARGWGEDGGSGAQARCSEATLYNWKRGGAAVGSLRRPDRLDDSGGGGREVKKLWPSRCWMQPRSASFCQKNGRARRQARRRRASRGRDGPVGTAGLLDRQRGSQDDAAIDHADRRTQNFGRIYANDHNGSASAIGDCSSCCARTANRPGSTASTGSTAKRA